ncbi:MAG: aminoacyl-tRNA hydrolase [Bradymonadales bacterium]|nr:MAG: aminoacyl-tRNA hydrolase [Bradymonadales bacterium]
MKQRFCCLGLGNPGRKYQGTRHNIGFDWIDAVRDSFSLRAQDAKERFESEFYLVEDDLCEIHLLKPQTFMNRSGKALQSWQKKYQTEARLLVVYDDKDLSLGRIRYRELGSDGGHRGLRSIIESLGTEQIPRLRLGVGSEDIEQGDTSEFVLSRFAPTEKAVVARVLEAAPEHFRAWLQEPESEALMSQINSWRASQGENEE